MAVEIKVVARPPRWAFHSRIVCYSHNQSNNEKATKTGGRSLLAANPIVYSLLPSGKTGLDDLKHNDRKLLIDFVTKKVQQIKVLSAAFDVSAAPRMLRGYLAIKEFLRLGEGSDGSVVSCIVVTGSEP